MRTWIETHITLKSVLKLILLLALGSAGGYAYYHYVGCSSGTCPITSNPWSSMSYGVLVALVMGYGQKK